MSDKGQGRLEWLGVFLQVPGVLLLLMCLSERESARPQVIVIGLAFLAIGFLFCAMRGFRWARYLCNWLLLLVVFDCMEIFTCACVVFTQNYNGSAAPLIIGAVVFALALYVKIRLRRWLKRRFIERNGSAGPAKAAFEASNPTGAAGQLRAEGSLSEAERRIASIAEAMESAEKAGRTQPPEAQGAVDARAERESSGAAEAPTEAPTEAPATPAGPSSIEALAASVGPSEQECFSAAGQAALLDAAVRALPMLGALREPGLCGDRLVHASDGGEAHDALMELLPIVERLLGGMSEGEMERLFRDLTRPDALLAWKALHFYAGMSEQPGAYEAACALLARKLEGRMGP